MTSFPRIKGRICRIQNFFLFSQGKGLELVIRMGGPIWIWRLCLGSPFIPWQIIHLQNMLKYRIILLQLSSFKATLCLNSKQIKHNILTTQNWDCEIYFTRQVVRPRIHYRNQMLCKVPEQHSKQKSNASRGVRDHINMSIQTACYCLPCANNNLNVWCTT